MSQEMPGSQPPEIPEVIDSARSQAQSWRDRLDSATRDLNNRTRELIDEGNTKRLVLERNGRPIANMPLTVAAVIGGATVLIQPWLAVVGFAGALLARVNARVEKEQ